MWIADLPEKRLSQCKVPSMTVRAARPYGAPFVSKFRSAIVSKLHSARAPKLQSARAPEHQTSKCDTLSFHNFFQNGELERHVWWFIGITTWLLR